MADYEQDLIARLRRGTSEPLVPITPGPADDREAAVIARLRSDALTNKLITPATKANPKGQVLETPGWNLGMSVANGMAQGFLPQMLAIPQSGGLEEGGGTLDPTFASRYEQNVNQLKARRVAYEHENPGKAMTGEIGGSMATAIPLMATGAGALAPLGARVAGMAPWMAGVVDFLTGAAGKTATTAAQKAATTLPNSTAARVGSLATRGTIEGAEGAAIASGLSEKPLGDQIKTGAGIGAVVNPVVGKVIDKLGSHVSRTAADSAQALIDQDIAIRAGQIPGSNKVAQGLDKVFGGGNAAQREAYGERLTGFAGLPEKEVSQAWVAKNDQRVGKVMNDIQSVYSIPQMEGGLLTDLSSIRKYGVDNLSVDNAVKVDGFIRKIEENLYNPMTGGVYKNLTQKGGLLDNMSKDKDIANVVPKLREALDDAWGRSLPADKKAAWDQARREYKVTRVIDDSMGATGAAEGVYNPKKLLKAVEDRYGNVENAGELGLLARGGQFLEPPGAAPASNKHGPTSMIGKSALFLAGGAAANEGSKVITHWGPEAMNAVAQHPETLLLPFLLAGGLYGGGKAANAAMNSPRATQYLLDVSRGSRAPTLRGTNPLIPFLAEGYNRQ